MAYAKCDAHGPHEGRTHTYLPEPALPVGYPNSAVICSAGECERPAKIYLTAEEWAEYRAGRRIFRYPREGVKVALAEPPR